MNEETYQKILAIAKQDKCIRPQKFGIYIGANALWERVIPDCGICAVAACLLGKPVSVPGVQTWRSMTTQFGKEFGLTEKEVNIFIAGFDSKIGSPDIENPFWIAGQRMATEFGFGW